MIQDFAQYAPHALLVAAVVSAVRRRVKGLEGWAVLLVALAATLLVVVGLGAVPVPLWVKQVAVVYLYAVGGVSLAKDAKDFARVRSPDSNAEDAAHKEKDDDA